jgi:hypothetical protein
MQDLRQRRNFLKLASIVFPFHMLGFEPRIFGLTPPEQRNSSKDTPVADLFPTQPPELVREMVTVAHYDLNRVKELVEVRPSLARAAWDWGFGDWETALGAASHMGNRPIAEYLISKGARPSLFSSAMLGHLEVVRAFVAAQPGVQRIRGPHSISLLAHAKAGGQASRPVFEFLRSVGDADADPLVPLSDSEAEGLRGSYVFGPAMSQQIEVAVDGGELTWTRTGMMGRPLFHLGSRAFYPAGAPAARIRFREEGSAMLMTIEDPEVVLVARRKQEPK